MNYIRDMVDSDPVVIFTYSQCPYSKQAMLLFRQVGHEPKHTALDKIRISFFHFNFITNVHDDAGQVDLGEEMHSYLKRISGRPTPPYVFVRGDFVGGIEHVIELLERNPISSLISPSANKLPVSILRRRSGTW